MTSSRARLALLLPVLLVAATSALAIDVPTQRRNDAIHADATRIVSIGGAVTEIVYALGLGARVVGVDTTSLYPPEALAQKPSVGYMRQLSPEGVLGLNPQLILAIEGAGPKDALAVLGEARVPLVTVPERFSEEGLLAKIATIARTLGVEARGACLADAVAADFAQMRTLRARIGKPLRVMFVLSLAGGRAMVAGRNTAANEIIALAGGVNAIDSYEGYKPVGEEAVVAAKPDVVLAMQRGSESLTAEAVFGNPGFALTPAGASRSFVAMDGLYLLGFGPRTAAAARDLSHALYPASIADAAGEKPRSLSVDCRNL